MRVGDGLLQLADAIPFKISRKPSDFLLISVAAEAPLLPKLILSLALCFAFAAPTATAEGVRCIKLGSVTAFQPRGEIYVQVNSTCSAVDFERDDPIVSHVEVLVGGLPPATQEVVVYGTSPTSGGTLLFSGLSLEPGDPVLVRLMRFGEILHLHTLRVP